MYEGYNAFDEAQDSFGGKVKLAIKIGIFVAFLCWAFTVEGELWANLAGGSIALMFLFFVGRMLKWIFWD